MRWEQMLAFQVQCDRMGLATPPPVLRGLELLEVAEAHQDRLKGSVLDLSDEQARERITGISIRLHEGSGADTRGMHAGFQVFRDQLQTEVAEACLPYVEELVEQLRPKFAKAAAPLVDGAQKWGFTLQTSSDDVIDMANEKASAAWRAARDAWTAVNPFVTFRRVVSETLTASPTHAEAKAHRGFGHYDPSLEKIDYSVCFAEGENWSWDGGFNIDRKPGAGIDWFALAAGGLRLNSPSEVAEKQQRKADILA